MARFDLFIGVWNTTGEVLATEASAAGALVATDTYRWLPGKHFIVHDLAFRTCCSNCGSALTMQYHCYPSKTHVAVGSVVEGTDSLPKVGMHIWVRRAPAWYSIPQDGVERWDEFDPQFDKVLDDFKQGADGGTSS